MQNTNVNNYTLKLRKMNNVFPHTSSTVTNQQIPPHHSSPNISPRKDNCPICRRSCKNTRNTKSLYCKNCNQGAHLNCITISKPDHINQKPSWNCYTCLYKTNLTPNSSSSSSSHLTTSAIPNSTPSTNINTPNQHISNNPHIANNSLNHATTQPSTPNMNLARTPPNMQNNTPLFDQHADILNNKDEPSNKDLMNVMKTILKSQEFISNQFDEFRGNVRQLQEENHHLKTSVNKLEDKVQVMENEIDTMQSELNKIQQEKLANHLVITGIPTDQHPLTIINTIGKILKTDLIATDIKNSRFLQPKNKPLKYAPLLIELYKTTTSELLMQKYKQNGPLLPTQLNIPQSHSIKKIFINEYLTDKNRNVLTQARKLRNTHGFKFIWYKNGFIWAKLNEESNAFKLSSMTDLQKMILELNN